MPINLAALIEQQPQGNHSYVWFAVIAVVVVLLYFSFTLLLMKQFKRCPSNRVLVITGKTDGKDGKPKCIHGGSAFVMPLLQNYTWLSLDPMRFDLPLSGASKNARERIEAAGTFSVAVGTTPELMQAAAERLVAFSSQKVRDHAEVIINEVVKRCFAAATVEEIENDREKMLQTIRDSLGPELNKLGLVLLSFYADFDSERKYR